MAAAMGILNLVLETDALTVKAALEGNDHRLSPLGGAYCRSKAPDGIRIYDVQS